MNQLFRLRFSLRILLLSLTAFLAWLGFAANRAHRQRTSVDAVAKLGGSVYFDYQLREVGSKLSHPSGIYTVLNERNSYMLDRLSPSNFPVPATIRRVIGDHMFVKVVAVHLQETAVTDRDLECLSGLPGIQVLKLSHTKVTDQALACLVHLKKLEEVALDGTDTSGRGLRVLRQLPRLEKITLHATSMSDAAQREVEELFPNVEIVWTR